MEPKTGSTDLVSLGNEEQVLKIVAGSIFNLWEAVNNLTRLQPTKRDRYRVTIFGSARVPKDHWVYGAVRDLAAELTRLDCDIVTGGGPGLMQAANEGASAANAPERNRSVGIRVECPRYAGRRQCMSLRETEIAEGDFMIEGNKLR
jgi:hypothetical protein